MWREVDSSSLLFTPPMRWLTYYPKLANYSSLQRSVQPYPTESCRLERESSLRLLSKGWAGFTGQVNHLGKVTKDLWTAVLQQIKWVALLNLSLNNYFLRIVYSVITSCYFTRCKFYHNSCSMVQKCEVDKKQHPARAPCENHLMQITLANSEANRRVTLRYKDYTPSL